MATLRKVVPYTQRFDTRAEADKLYAMIDAAKGANAILRQWFEKAQASEDPDGLLGIRTKSNVFEHEGFKDVLSKADMDAEKFIIQKLTACANIPVLAEESGYSADDASLPDGSRRWLIDPVDGTHCFVNGSADFSVTIALQEKVVGKWQTQIGLVSIPMHDEIFVADTQSAHLVQGDREKQLHVHAPEIPAFSGSKEDVLRGKKIEVVIYDANNRHIMDALGRMQTHLRAQSLPSTTFSTALAITKLADGWIDGAIVAGHGALQYPWDTDAAVHIAGQAGAKIKRFDLDGSPAVLIANSSALLHAMEATLREQYHGATLKLVQK